MDKNNQTDKNKLSEASSNLTISEEEIIYTILGSKVRRDILSFIKNQQKVGFLELREHFKLKVGSLYHQLNSMKELIVQDDNKKYSLSELGEIAYNLLIINKDYIAASQDSVSLDKKNKLLSKIYESIIFVFLPRKIFRYLALEPVRTFFEGLIVIGALLFFSIDSLTVLIGFFPLTVDLWVWSLVGIIAQWLFLGLMTELLNSLFHKRKFKPFRLLAIIPFTMVPMLVAQFFIWLQGKVTSTFLFMDGQIVIILSQIWALSLMTTATNQTKELKMNRSSLIVLFTFYFIYAISFIFVSIE